MQNIKRVAIATSAGLVFGLVCLGLASSGPTPPPWPAAVQIVISRTLIGVAIGISSVTLGHWLVHGLIMGLLFGLPLAFGGLMAPDNADFSRSQLFIWTVMLGMVYGALIELFTTVVFKAGQRR